MRTITLSIIYITILLLSAPALFAQQSTRKVLVEDITGAWCGFCPDGTASLTALKQAYGDQIIAVGVHVNDSMENATSSVIGDEYTGNGVNAFMLDRFLFPNEDFVQLNSSYTSLHQHIAERLAMPPIVQVNFETILYNPETRELSVELNAVFSSVPIETDLRFNLWITQDSIVGSGSGYNQANFFNNYAGHPYFGAGNTIYNFPHRHVLRVGLNGAWGSAIANNPNEIIAGHVYTKSYTITLPEQWDTNRLSLIGMVQSHNENLYARPILNANEHPLMQPLPTPNDTSTNNNGTPVGIKETGLNLSKADIFPNPIADQPLQISFNLKKSTQLTFSLYDAQGRKMGILHKAQFPIGTHNLTINLAEKLPILPPNGQYWLTVESAEQLAAKPFHIKR